MKRLALIFLIAAGLVGALIVFRPREKAVALRDLTWNDRGASATYDFRLANPTEEEVVVGVVLVAERTLEHRTGAKIDPAGQTRLEVRLGAKEEKKESGQIALASSANGFLTVFPYITVKKPNQPPEPTPTSRGGSS